MPASAFAYLANASAKACMSGLISLGAAFTYAAKRAAPFAAEAPRSPLPPVEPCIALVICVPKPIIALQLESALLRSIFPPVVDVADVSAGAGGSACAVGSAAVVVMASSAAVVVADEFLLELPQPAASTTATRSSRRRGALRMRISPFVGGVTSSFARAAPGRKPALRRPCRPQTC